MMLKAVNHDVRRITVRYDAGCVVVCWRLCEDIHVAGRSAVVKWVKDDVHVDSRSHVFELVAITKSWTAVRLAG